MGMLQAGAKGEEVGRLLPQPMKSDLFHVLTGNRKRTILRS